jgi:hypothetical protein
MLDVYRRGQAGNIMKPLVNISKPGINPLTKTVQIMRSSEEVRDMCHRAVRK